MAFRGREPIRTKIMFSDGIIEQLSHFNHFGMTDIGYDRNCNIDVKLGKVSTALWNNQPYFLVTRYIKIQN